MAWVHFLYVGHFEREKGFVKLRDTELVIEKPLDEKIVQRMLAGVGLTLDSIPKDWYLEIEDGYLVCDRYGSSNECIKFIASLSTETGCDIFDKGSFRLVLPEQLLAAI
ncbi:hypothetical protein AYO44_03100 [Planctomycetaceae bacterium SCGC AG-212-F19]|nr:hypothetical protein AYO44_03100 [Planctomycetaceae bacterium SCGC AG-212-F19]